MTRAPILLFRPAAALAGLGLAVPLGAQSQSPESFSLPEPTPTPTPAPAGPADERAGVAIPPRVVETPRIAPAPMLVPEPSPTPRPLVVPQPTSRPVTPPATSAPQAAPSPEVSPSATVDPLPSEVQPGFAGLEQPANTAPAPAEPATPAPSSALGQQVSSWVWLAGAAAVLVLGLAGLALWRRRKPKVLSLAAPLATHEPSTAPGLPRLDLTLEITGATRSMMMFTLQYRLSLANRSDRAVNDLALAVQLASAQQGQSNAAPVAAARRLAQVERIGPHQSRSVTGEVQMPLSAIIPIMQGQTPLFIPLVHVTLEGAGQQTLARSFVVGSPSGGSDGRVQPLPFHQPPGSLPGLRAKAIAAPAD